MPIKGRTKKLPSRFWVSVCFGLRRERELRQADLKEWNHSEEYREYVGGQIAELDRCISFIESIWGYDQITLVNK